MLDITYTSLNWQAYDARKNHAKQDPGIFTPEILWEFNSLLDIIIIAAPQLDPLTVTLAIRENMRSTIAPRPRKYFIDLVLSSIRTRENQLAQLIKRLEQDAA